MVIYWCRDPIENSNYKESLWYQVLPLSELTEEGDELKILLTVVEGDLTGNEPIVVANTDLKTMQILPRTIK